MKKYYRYIEILMSLRKEMLRLNNIIGKLQDYIKVDGDYESIKVNASLMGQHFMDNPFKVYVEVKKRYAFCDNKFKELVEFLKFSQKNLYPFFLTDRYDAISDNGTYSLVRPYNYRYEWITEEENSKIYRPSIVVTNKDAFNTILNMAGNTDIAKTRSKILRANHDMFEIRCNDLILGLLDPTYRHGIVNIRWDGLKDEFIVNLENADFDLYFHDLEIPSDKIPADILEILEKYENKFDKLVVCDISRFKCNKVENAHLKIDESKEDVIYFAKIK